MWSLVPIDCSQAQAADNSLAGGAGRGPRRAQPASTTGWPATGPARRGDPVAQTGSHNKSALAARGTVVARLSGHSRPTWSPARDDDKRFGFCVFPDLRIRTCAEVDVADVQTAGVVGAEVCGECGTEIRVDAQLHATELTRRSRAAAKTAVGDDQRPERRENGPTPRLVHRLVSRH